MTAGLFDTGVLVLISGVAVVAGVATVWLRLRRETSVASSATTLVVVCAVVLLVAHFGVSLLISGRGNHFNDSRWVLLSPWAHAGQALGIGAAVGVVLLAWLGTRELMSANRRLWIVSARGGAALAALVLFLEPAIELRDVAREPNRVAIVLDRSASMALLDDASGPSRWQRSLAFLRASLPTFEQWKARHRIDVYTFDRHLAASSEDAIASRPADGPSSDLRASLEELRGRYEVGELAGVVVVSDGLATGSFADGAHQGPDIDFLRSLDTRVHTVWAGRPGLKDVAITKVLADEFAFVRTVVKIEVVVRITGYQGKRVPVTISFDGAPMRRKWAEVEPGRTETIVEFEFTPSKVGKFVYEVSTPVLDDEAVPQNNKRAFVVRVVRDKFRVLQVAGQPSWDVRALRGMLKQNPNVDLISFFILRTQDDIPQASQSEMSLIPFPTRELFEQQLPSFDLIVLQNFNFRPYGLAPYLSNIRDYVLRGGGLVMLGGALSLSSGGYAGTPLAEVLPLELYPESHAASLDDGEFRAKLTEAGATHPVTSLRYDRAENQARWSSLPSLQGINLVKALAKDAVALVVHPRLKSADGNAAPLVAVREVGEGRVMAAATDTLWHWGFVAAADGEGDGRAYDELWANATRWLIRDPELQLLQLSSDRIQYHPDDPVAIEVRLRGRDYKPLAEAKVMLEIRTGASSNESDVLHESALSTDATGQARLQLGALAAGVYRVRAKAKVSGREVSAADVFLVREASAELDRSAADSELLQEIAGLTGGTFLATTGRVPVDLPLQEPRVVRVDRSTDVELWSGPWLLLLCLGFLGLEWGLRQRSGYR